MTAGAHTVTVFTDPLAGDWSAPLASNPYLTDNLTGWAAGPFGTAWTWQPDGSASGGNNLCRSESYPVPRTPATLYRVRATVTLSVASPFTVALFYGTTPAGASKGPFWLPAEAVDQTWWTSLSAGTHNLEATFDPTGIDSKYIYVGPCVYTWGDTSPAFNVTTLELTQRLSPGVDLSCLVDSVSISHGRDDPASQPEASSATVDFTTTPSDPLPVEVDVGAVIEVATTVGTGASSQRFVGRITDIALGWDDAGADTPDAGVGQIVAVGPLADLGRRVVGAEPFPQELDGARVGRVLAAAGITLDPYTSDPGTVQILARDIDSQPALDVALDAATSANGVLWQTRGGDIRYADADHRRGTPAALALDACDLLVTPTWRRNLDGLVNSLSVGYGVTPEGGEQPRYVAADAASMSKWGTYEYTATTALAALADASAISLLLLARNSSPVWVMAALPVDVAGLDSDTYQTLLGLDMHSLLTLTGLPAVGQSPTITHLWVEGWREELTYGGHSLELVVSGYCRTAPPPRWDEASPAWRWGGETLTEQRRNLSVVPRVPTSGASGWRPNDATSHAVQLGAASPAPHPQGILTTAKVTALAPMVGTIAAASLYAVDGDAAPTATARGLGVWVWAPWPSDVRLYMTTGQAASDKTTRIPANTWSYCTTKAPATGIAIAIVYKVGSPVALNDAVWMTGSITEAGTVPASFFDGAIPDTSAQRFDWVGAAGVSASTQSAVGAIAGGVDPSWTWDSAACLGPPIDYGRWDDQPATLRWDQLNPETTWDQYGTGAL
jgi:hypothetical protein